MIVYFSVTGQTRRFVAKLADEPHYEIQPENPFVEMNEPYILVVPTYVAEVTEPVNDFLETGENVKWCRGIFGGGNRNFAQLFCFTAIDLARDYELPLLHLFEFQGSENDVNKMKEELALHVK